MTAWQLVDQTFKIVFTVLMVTFAAFGILELITTVASAAERNEFDDQSYNSGFCFRHFAMVYDRLVYVRVRIKERKGQY